MSAEYLTKAPASTMLVVPALAIPGALVEVEAIAFFPPTAQ
jgi:enamine deaminase RidA (YjgF/YER057c/UK114 family)